MNAVAPMAAGGPAKTANVESEAVIIGALMIDNRAIDRVADKLAAEDFSEALYGRVYSAIVREASLGRAANPVTLKPYLADDPALQEIGGVGYLAQLTANTTALLMLGTCVDQVIMMARRRRMIESLTLPQSNNRHRHGEDDDLRALSRLFFAAYPTNCRRTSSYVSTRIAPSLSKRAGQVMSVRSKQLFIMSSFRPCLSASRA